MEKNNKIKSYITGTIVLLLLLVVLILPIVLYIYQFGGELSSNHQRWAEFGSAISGIYSPIIALLALLILVGQFRSQIDMNKHQYDQAYIESNRNELNYFTEKLAEYLENNHKSGIKIREYLEKHFAYLSKEQLNEQSVKKLAKEIRNDHKIILDMWIAIYPLLQGLESNKEFPYKHNFSSAILRITCTLSIETCIAIDNFYYVQTNDIGKGKYSFSREI